MIKKLLFTVVLVLSLVAGNSTATTTKSTAKTQFLNNEYKTPQYYGLFKLHHDRDSNFAISPSKRLQSAISREQIHNMVQSHHKRHISLESSKQKAKSIYEFLSKVAVKANFMVHMREDYNNRKFLRIVIFEQGIEGVGHLLLRPKDMREVLPLLIKLIKTNDKDNFELSQRYYQAGDPTMYSFNAWPVDEEWYGGWDRWVRDEMKSFCIGGDGESFCSHYDVEFRDFDEDDINDSVCGVYYHYFGTNEVEFHCVER